MQRDELVAHLRTLGVDEASGLAFDATITPETLLGPFPSARPPGAAALVAAPPGASVGPLPRIGLSGLVSGQSASDVAVSGASGRIEDPADFEILSVLGEGGMGRVHLARQRSLGRDVAIKTLKAEVADVHAVEMLREEATTMGRLEHPNMVPVHAVGRDDSGRLLLVMKRVDGVAWSDLLHDPHHPRWEVLAPRDEDRLELHLSVLAQVANALEFAHSRGVVHRDVKPENVLLGEHGEVYLADWGIALRLGGAASMTLVGTPAYMAPEMVRADSTRIDARTDVFLLGATLHEVLTGQPPHSGASIHAVLVAAHDALPPSYGPEVPSELAAIARRAMAASPEDRFPSALAFRQALDERRRHAGALALVRSGRELLADLEAAPQGSAGGGPDVDRKLTECRFAFVQALRIWPENEDAREGLDQALRLAVQHELGRENPVAARSLLAELHVPDAALLARVLALETTLASRLGAVQKLEAIAADADLRVGLRSRMILFGFVTAAGVAISAYFSLGPRADAAPPSGQEIVGVALLFIAIVAVGSLLLRKHLLANLAGRQAIGLLAGGLLGLLAHRVIGAANGVSTLSVLAMDFVVLGLASGAAGLIVPRASWAALVPVLGAVLSALYPAHVVVIFSSFSVLTVLAVAALWLGSVRARDRSDG